jgi:hypothetical protein
VGLLGKLRSTVSAGYTQAANIIIGISKSVVQSYNAMPPAPTVTAFEVSSLGATVGQPLNNWPKMPSYSLSSANNAKTAMLGLLAHEMAHIIYRNGEPFSKCFDTTWKKPLGGQEKRFHKFGVPFRGSETLGDVDVTDIRGDLSQPPNYDDALTDLNTLMGNSNGALSTLSWASALATIAPDEDFAETFRLMVLYEANPSVRDLTINIPVPTSYNISPYDISGALIDPSQNLYKKANCFAGVLGLTFP